MRVPGGLGFRGGIVDTDGGTTLNKRAGPGTGYKVVGTVADGATVTVACSKLGTRHVGRNNYSSNLWNRLTDGTASQVPPIEAPQALMLTQEPEANVARYDSLRSRQGGRHAS